MKNIIVLLLVFGWQIMGVAQTDNRIAKGTQPLAAVPQRIMPKQDNATLMDKEMSKRRPGRAAHFAVPMQVHITPDTHGLWETTPEGIDIWRMRIYSEKAKSLNLGFTKYVMPEGGKMILYTADSKEVRGPFTPHDNEEHEQLWTPVLTGDELVVEVQLPLQNRHALQLELSAVNHDFIGFQQMASGSCNLDVLCGAADGFPEVDDYRDIIQSVAFMHVNGFANCTGFLVNNTGQDCRPLFMSAYHCDIGVQDAPTLVTYWNFQNSYCRQPFSPQSGADGDGQLNTFNSGSTLLASYEPTDFVLMELDDPVVEEANAFFAGWNAEEVFPTRAIAIHHPSNEEKRISFENDDDFYTGTWAGGPDNIPDGDHIVVADWDVGTTEGGSSGSPLFDQNKRIIGQLHGGGAACGNDDYDTYGWFAKSWEGGGTPQTRLKDWLDPSNSEIKIMDGNNCSLSVADAFIETCNSENTISTEVLIGGIFSNTVNLSVQDIPVGLNVTLDATSVAPNTTTTLTISNISSLSGGLYSFSVLATDGNKDGATVINLQVYEAIQTPPTLLTPVQSASSVSTFGMFDWQTTENDIESQLQIATDANFTNIILDESGITTSAWNNTILEPLSTYYWRVRTSNLCGQGTWAATHVFMTSNILCEEVSSQNVPITISDGPSGTYTSTLTINQTGTIEDINIVNLVGTHSWISDLSVRLISPQGTQVLLWQEQCGSEEDFNINFDDAGISSAFPCPPTDGGTYQPTGSLADFNGEDITGTWTLEIVDDANQDGGSLESWTLEYCITPDASLSTSVNGIVPVCNHTPFEFSINVSDVFEENIVLIPSISPNAPFKLTYDTDLNNVTPGTVINAMIASFDGIALGDYTLTFSTMYNGAVVSTAFTVQLLSTPEVVSLIMPENTADNVPRNPTFQWSVETGSGYFIEVSVDDNFGNILHSNPLSSNTYIYPSELDAFTEYFWRVKSENICGESYSEVFNFTTGNTVSVATLDAQDIHIFPNPTQGQLHIEWASTINETVEIKIFDLYGKHLLSQKARASQSNTTLDLAAFAKGIYLVHISTAQRVLTQRIVLQ